MGKKPIPQTRRICPNIISELKRTQRVSIKLPIGIRRRSQRIRSAETPPDKKTTNEAFWSPTGKPLEWKRKLVPRCGLKTSDGTLPNPTMGNLERNKGKQNPYRRV